MTKRLDEQELARRAAVRSIRKLCRQLSWFKQNFPEVYASMMLEVAVQRDLTEGQFIECLHLVERDLVNLGERKR